MQEAEREFFLKVGYGVFLSGLVGAHDEWRIGGEEVYGGGVEHLTGLQDDVEPFVAAAVSVVDGLEAEASAVPAVGIDAQGGFRCVEGHGPTALWVEEYR